MTRLNPHDPDVKECVTAAYDHMLTLHQISEMH